MRALAAGAIVALMAFGPCVAGATEAPNSSPSAAKAKPKSDPHDPDKVICKTKLPIGSRLGGKTTCMTRAEWDNAERGTRAEMDRSTISSGGTIVTPNN